jgi:hypothetical protein
MIDDHDKNSFLLSFRNVVVLSLAVPGLGARIQADGLQRWGLLIDGALGICEELKRGSFVTQN